MGLLRHVLRCNAWTPDSFLPFLVEGRRVGRVRKDFAPVCARHPDAFAVTDRAVSVAPRLTTFEDRTHAVGAALHRMAEMGHLASWRGEPFAVAAAPGGEVFLHMERAAVARFGILGVGVHLNGFVRTPGGPSVWVGRRSPDKPTEPGKLDQLVAGGQPATLGLTDNLIKECAEEADIPEDLARRARPVGAVTYTLELENGLRRDILYVYDLELPADFAPRNTDGEIDHFMLWPAEEVVRSLRETDDWKFNCTLVAIDFLIRHGVLTADDPEYLPLLNGLRTHDGTQ